MKRPAFQFYPGDWQRNANLRRCSPAARGVWVDVMCMLHDSDEYGVLRWPLKDIAQAAGASMGHIRELVEKTVLKGSDKQLTEAYVYTPRSGRKDGEPVILIPAQAGPIWYSSRMVKDEYVRTHAGASTRFGSEEKCDPPPARKPSPDSDRAKLRARVLAKTDGICYHCSCALADPWEIDHLLPRSKGGRHTFANLVPSCVACNQDKSDTLPDDWAALSRSPSRRHGEAPGEHQGDGSTSTSATAVNSEAKASGGKPPTNEEIIFSYGVGILVSAGSTDKAARSFLGGLRKGRDDTEVVNALRDCIRAKPLQPLEWLAAALPPSGARAHASNNKHSGAAAAIFDGAEHV